MTCGWVGVRLQARAADEIHNLGLALTGHAGIAQNDTQLYTHTHTHML